MKWTSDRRMGAVALGVFALDQASKLLVMRFLGPTDERVVIDGFFKFVHWGNTGAAWSLFHDRNELLAIVSILALLGLFLWRRHFYLNLGLGQLALGLIMGGICGNLFDRLYNHQVIDFLRFYVYRRSGEQVGFPAFNVADSAICIGVGLLILTSWQQESAARSGKMERDERKAEA
ncbi:MAG TPA: signal peptidase II [Verrucomicrobiae bacterium]|jgi:signal peptidase II|nr:signal peptidase II [Verrucomicrobiae bacterium]